MPAINLFPYQRKWLDDRSRFKCGCWSRQIGKTFTATLELVLDCLDHEATGHRKRWVILSRGERQAKEAMDEGVKRHLRAMQTGFRECGYDWSASVKALEVELPGGSRITALPANPDTARGFSASVLADEFAFHQNPQAIWQSLYPVISAGHDLRVISTPNGQSGLFYRLIHEESEWSKHIVNIYDAVSQGLDRNIEELKAGLGDDYAFRQEYLCEFVDEATTWLPYELIQTCEHEDAGHPEGYLRHATYIGNDIGRHRDLWVAWVLERIGDVLWTREVSILKKASFAEQDAELDRLVRTYRPARIAMDKTGMGEKPVEDAQRRYGASVVEGISFSIQSKYQLATIGKQAFERRLWRVPIDRACRDDFHKLKRTTTLSGAPKFDAEADATGHADRAWAGFLALYAAGTGVAIEGAYAKSPSSTPDYSARRKAAIGGVASGGRIGGWV